MNVTEDNNKNMQSNDKMDFKINIDTNEIITNNFLRGYIIDSTVTNHPCRWTTNNYENCNAEDQGKPLH